MSKHTDNLDEHNPDKALIEITIDSKQAMKFLQNDIDDAVKAERKRIKKAVNAISTHRETDPLELLQDILKIINNAS